MDQFARKVEALCVWGDKLLAGLADGSLLFFEQQQRPAGATGASPGGTAAAWQVTHLQKQFMKRAVSQLLALPGQDLLFSLSGGLHDRAPGGGEGGALLRRGQL